MGFLDNCIGSSRGEITKAGNHSIVPADVLARTNEQAINPARPPAWNQGNVSTGATLTSWRPMTWAEAEALNEQAFRREAQSDNWHKAVDALKRMEDCDANDQKAFRSYQEHGARAEFKKLKANASLAQLLHRLRPQYSGLFQGIDTEDTRAERGITELKNKYTALMY